MMQKKRTIQSVLLELGIDFKEVGKEAVAKCPAHNDNHPSWSCNLKTGVHHCFSCGFSGNLASLVSHVLGLNYTESVIWCNERIGMARAHEWREDYENKNFAPNHFRMSEVDLAILDSVPDDLLASKKLTREAADEFEIKWKSEEEQWVFPIRDPYTYKLWGVQLKNGRIFRTYPAGIRKSETLFGLRAFTNGEPAILVESPVDTVRLRSAGIRGGLSGMGVSISDRQFSLILGVTDSLVLALDNDSAGVAETARICRIFKQIPEIKIFNYGVSKAKDPGEMTDREIHAGYETALSSINWLRTYENLQRKITSLPRGASGPVSFERELTHSLLYGIREDGNWHSSG